MNREIIIQAAIARALIKMNGMIAENTACSVNGEYLKYYRDDFERIINEEGIGFNDVIIYLQ